MPVAAASIAGTNNANSGAFTFDVQLEEVEEDDQAAPPANWEKERERNHNNSLRPSSRDMRPSSRDIRLSGQPQPTGVPPTVPQAKAMLSPPGQADGDHKAWTQQPGPPVSNSNSTGRKRSSFQEKLQNMKESHAPDASYLRGVFRDQHNEVQLALRKGSERLLEIFEEITMENARLNNLLVAAGVPEENCGGKRGSISQAQAKQSYNINEIRVSHLSDMPPELPSKPQKSSSNGGRQADKTTELTPVMPMEAEEDVHEAHDDFDTHRYSSMLGRTGGFGAFMAVSGASAYGGCSQDLAMKSNGFSLLSVWQDMNPAKLGWSRNVKQPTMMANMLSKFIEEEEKEAELAGNGGLEPKDWYIIHPNSGVRATWDLISLSAVVYDMAAIPFELFNPPENFFLRFMIWTTRIFWTLDMPLSLFSGYVTSAGAIELRHCEIVRHYLRSWFGLDIIIVGVDWLELVLEASSVLGFAKAGKAARVIRILRMIRLLRLVRMKEVFSLFTERITSEKVIITLDICRLMLLIVAIAHFVACLWYGVGDQDGPNNWIRRHGYHRVGLGEAYLMSLHWSLSQFAGGMDEVTPKNEAERLFTVVVFIFAFIIATVFVSSLTSSMTQLKHMSSHQAQQLSILRRYLRQHRISSRLGLRVQRSAVSALQERQRFMPEDGVQLLRLVSEPLCVEIHTQIYTPLLSNHPFFKAYMEHVPQVMRKVCHSATSFMMVSNGDVIFSAGESPPHPKMYFVVHGALIYHPFDGVSTTVHELRAGNWIAEATLWTEWIHHGLLKAKTDCRLCVLDAKRFQNIAIQFEHSDFNPKSYATQFIWSLNGAEEVNDLPCANLPIAQYKAKTKFDLKQYMAKRAPTMSFSLTSSKRASQSDPITRASASGTATGWDRSETAAVNRPNPSAIRTLFNAVQSKLRTNSRLSMLGFG